MKAIITDVSLETQPREVAHGIVRIASARKVQVQGVSRDGKVKFVQLLTEDEAKDVTVGQEIDILLNYETSPSEQSDGESQLT